MEISKYVLRKSSYEAWEIAQLGNRSLCKHRDIGKHYKVWCAVSVSHPSPGESETGGCWDLLAL